MPFCSRPANELLRPFQRLAIKRHNSVISARQLRSVVAASSSSTVKLNVQGRHLDVTPAIEEYVRERLTNVVSKFEGGVKEVVVRLSAAGGDRGAGAKRQKVEITVYTLRNGVVRAEDEEANLYTAVDLVADKVKLQLRKMKEKAIAKGKWAGSGGPKGAQVITDIVDWEDATYTEPEGKDVSLPDDVMRTKALVLHPVSVDEAVGELELTDHDFHLFQEITTGRVQLVYKRRHGGVGLLKPTLVQDL